MSPPAIVDSDELNRRLCTAIVATARGEAPPFLFARRWRPDQLLCVLEDSAGLIGAKVPGHFDPFATAIGQMDQEACPHALTVWLDCRWLELRAQAEAGKPLTPKQRCMIHFWAAVRGDIDPISYRQAERLFGDAPELLESPGCPDRFVWPGIDRAMPKTPDTDAAAEAAQLLVELGGEDQIELAAGVLCAAFEKAMETPMSRYLAKLIHYSKYLTPDGSRKFAGPESEGERLAREDAMRAQHHLPAYPPALP